MISLTESAIKQLHVLVQEQGDTSAGLRIFVEKGGCAGLQYGMKMDQAREGDEVHEEQGVHVVIDRDSLPYLRGSTLDYADDLTGTGFRLKNPNAARSCGCGTSFEASQDESQTHQH